MTLHIVGLLLCWVSFFLDIIYVRCCKIVLYAECHYDECHYAGFYNRTEAALNKSSLLVKIQMENTQILQLFFSQYLIRNYLLKCEAARLRFGRPRIYMIRGVEHKGLKVSCKLVT